MFKDIREIMDNFTSNQERIGNIVTGEDVILRGAAAVEYMNYFVGHVYGNEKIDVYSLREGENENVSYHIIDSFTGLDYFQDGDVLCSTISQAINDILADYETADMQTLLEALNNYYYEHKKSYEGLIIAPENIELFNKIKPWAIENNRVG